MSGHPELAKVIGDSRRWLDVPAIGAAVFNRGVGSEVVVSGRRSEFEREQVGQQDMWHIGSCTKAMTATILARLAERGLLDFDATLGESLPRIASRMHPGFSRTTLRQVLTHTAGIIRDPHHSTFSALRRSKGTARAQRRLLALQALRIKPWPEAGYSNVGYIVLGAVIEHVMDMAWEDVLAAEVMHPLGISGYGFGAPGNDRVLEQPRGHRRFDGIWRVQTASRWGDNPKVYGPAGRVHIRLADWVRFLRVHLNAGPPSYLRPSTLSAMHQPAQNGYAMGWRVTRSDDTGEIQLHHAGSNTAWFAQALLLPQRGAGVGIVCNGFEDGVETAVGKLATQSLASTLPDADTPP